MGFSEKEVGRMTLGKIITLYREYKHDWDLEESLRRSRKYYSDLADLVPKKEHIISF